MRRIVDPGAPDRGRTDVQAQLARPLPRVDHEAEAGIEGIAAIVRGARPELVQLAPSDGNGCATRRQVLDLHVHRVPQHDRWSPERPGRRRAGDDQARCERGEDGGAAGSAAMRTDHALGPLLEVRCRIRWAARRQCGRRPIRVVRYGVGGCGGALMSRPRRVRARLDSAATPIAISARSSGGSGRTTERNWSARARSIWARSAGAVRGHRHDPLPPVRDLLVACQQPAGLERGDDPAGRRRGAADLLREVRHGERRRPSRGIQRGQLCEPESKLAELGGEPDHEVPPERPAHRDPIREEPRILQLVPRGDDRLAQRTA